MRPMALRWIISALIFSIVTPAPVWSQWSLSLGVQSDRFWGGSVENAPERKSFRPYRPTLIAVGLERRAGSAGLALRVRYTEASLGLEGSDAVVALKGAFTVLGIAPELNYQLLTLGPGNRVLVHAGPLLEFWDPVDVQSRTRLGAQGAVSLRIPMGGRFGLSLAGSVALIASPLQSDELIDGYELRPLWRLGFAAELQSR